MKRFVSLVAILAVALSITAFAGDHGKKMSVDEKIAWMTKELNLTADQQTQLKPVLEEQQKQIEAVLQDASLSDDVKKAKKTEIKSQTSTKIKALLDTSQQEKYATLTQPKPETAAAKQ